MGGTSNADAVHPWTYQPRIVAPRVVVVGSYGVGLTVVTDQAPGPGETVIGRSFASGHGGKGSNQAVAAARLGATVTLCSAVGSDTFGDSARALWDDEDVDHGLVTTLPGATMVGVIIVESSGENRIAIASGVLAEFGVAHLGRLDRTVGLDDVLAEADVLLVGLEIPLTTAVAALQAGRRAGVTTVLNPAPAPLEPLAAEVLALVDHLVPNHPEALALTGLPATTSLETLLHSPALDGVGSVVVTLGESGAMLRHRHGIESIPATPVVAVDTTGAGDTFVAAYAVELAGGAEPVAAARFAARAAAITVTTPEVIPALPWRHQLDESFEATARRA